MSPRANERVRKLAPGGFRGDRAVQPGQHVVILPGPPAAPGLALSGPLRVIENEAAQVSYIEGIGTHSTAARTGSIAMFNANDDTLFLWFVLNTTTTGTPGVPTLSHPRVGSFDLLATQLFTSHDTMRMSLFEARHVDQANFTDTMSITPGGDGIVCGRMFTIRHVLPQFSGSRVYNVAHGHASGAGTTVPVTASQLADLSLLWFAPGEHFTGPLPGLGDPVGRGASISPGSGDPRWLWSGTGGTGGGGYLPMPSLIPSQAFIETNIVWNDPANTSMLTNAVLGVQTSPGAQVPPFDGSGTASTTDDYGWIYCDVLAPP